MPVKTGPNTYFTYDFWHGYPGERREILEHIKAKGIKDVVFLTGDIHTFAAGDVQITEGGESVATEIVGGSVTSLALGEGDIPIGGGVILPGNDAEPEHVPGRSSTRSWASTRGSTTPTSTTTATSWSRPSARS